MELYQRSEGIAGYGILAFSSEAYIAQKNKYARQRTVRFSLKRKAPLEFLGLGHISRVLHKESEHIVRRAVLVN